jgi:hypothetical protein
MIYFNVAKDILKPMIETLFKLGRQNSEISTELKAKGFPISLATLKYIIISYCFVLIYFRFHFSNFEKGKMRLSLLELRNKPYLEDNPQFSRMNFEKESVCSSDLQNDSLAEYIALAV